MQVCEHDYLPKVVCSNCVQMLEQCFTFRQNSINSETMLSNYFSNFRFTDDFKKAGKVYVKDTGQPKMEIHNSGNTVKKGANIVNSASDSGQFFNQPSISSNKQTPDYVTVHPVINQPVIKMSQEAIKYSSVNVNIKTNEDQNCQNFQNNLNAINQNNFNQNQIITSKQPFETQSQPMMFIDIEQLIGSGLPEAEINKLKEALLKPFDSNNKPKQVPNNGQQISTVSNGNNCQTFQIQNNKMAANTDMNNKLEDNVNKITAQDVLDVSISNNVLNNINNNQTKSIEITNGVKHFKCQTCDKLFKRREHLYQHTKLHSGLRPFSCVHCPKTFSRKEHLIRHLTSHSGQKDYTCETCNKKFSRPDNLKKHKKTHQKSGPFICEVCSKSFVIKHYYLAHKLQHNEGETSRSLLKIQ